MASFKEFIKGYETENYKTPKDDGEIRTFPNETGSRMAKDNEYIGDTYSIAEAFGIPKQASISEISKVFKPIGRDEDGADIWQAPDGYYSRNPLVYGESFKTLDALNNFYKKK